MTNFKAALHDNSDPLYAPLTSISRNTVYWRPTKRWRDAGFTGKPVALPGRVGDGQDALRAAEARRLTLAMLTTLGQIDAAPGTWGEVISRYKTDRYSPFQSVRPRTRESYEFLCDRWAKAIGHIKLTETDFLMLKGIEGAMQEKGRSVSYIRRMFTMLRALASYGKLVKIPGARDVKETLSEMRFQMPPRKNFAPTREQVLAVVDEADARGHFAFATGVLMQWVFMLRGVDVFGQWVPARGHGGIVKDGLTWVDGLTWDMVAPDYSSFSKVISKTRKSLPDPLTFDLSGCPEIRTRLRLLATGGRVGPVIRMERGGLPYHQMHRARTFRRICDALDLPKGMSMMDTRAGAITEGQKIGLDKMTLRNAAGHTNSATTEGYMRGRDADVAKVIKIRGER